MFFFFEVRVYFFFLGGGTPFKKKGKGKKVRVELPASPRMPPARPAKIPRPVPNRPMIPSCLGF